jgi:hypothetical protein
VEIRSLRDETGVFMARRACAAENVRRSAARGRAMDARGGTITVATR